MDDKLGKVKEILKKYNQEHLLLFYNDLTDEQKSGLLNQIMNINFEEIMSLYKRYSQEEVVSTEEIEPLPYLIKASLPSNKMNQFYNNGIKAIKTGKVGVITLAGGQGSRLGLNAPKGTLCLDTTPKKSLFEILSDYIKSYAYKYNISIPWYIMTSTNNYFDTIDFFETNNFFGYNREDISFFTQENMPIISKEGKLILSEIYKINFASNGNGNLFNSLLKSNLIKDMEQRKLQWLFVGGIDNVLLDPLDPIFIGYTASLKKEIASKTIFKENPSDKSWIFAKKDKHPSIADCENFTEELSSIVDKKGNYLYREKNILAHLFSLNAIKKLSTIKLPYHMAFRKNAFVNEEGMKQVPDTPNVYKFEQFIFDAFSYFDSIALLRVNAEEEFSPIKDFTSIFNPEIAAQKYEKMIKNRKL